MHALSSRVNGRVPTAVVRDCRVRRLGAVRAVASADASTDRRSILLAGGLAVVASPFLASAPALAGGKFLPVSNLTSFQKSDIRTSYRLKAEDILRKELTVADAPYARKLAFNDAGTYDKATNTGGMDGSIVLSSELDRPENAALKPFVAKLKSVKAKVDAAAEVGQGAMSWADLIVLAAKVATQLEWSTTKIKRAKTESGGEIIAGSAYNSPFPVRLGRIDSTDAAPGGRVPQADAPVEEIRAYLYKLGNDPNYTPGIFTPKPPFWDKPGFLMWTETSLNMSEESARWAAAAPEFVSLKDRYDRSKRSLTRTDFEVDFADYFDKLTSLGATFDPDAYLYPLPLADLRL